MASALGDAKARAVSPQASRTACASSSDDDADDSDSRVVRDRRRAYSRSLQAEPTFFAVRRSGVDTPPGENATLRGVRAAGGGGGGGVSAGSAAASAAGSVARGAAGGVVAAGGAAGGARGVDEAGGAFSLRVDEAGAARASGVPAGGALAGEGQALRESWMARRASAAAAAEAARF